MLIAKLHNWAHQVHVTSNKGKDWCYIPLQALAFLWNCSSSLFLTVITRWRWMDSVTPWLPYLEWNSPVFLLSRGLVGPRMKRNVFMCCCCHCFHFYGLTDQLCTIASPELLSLMEIEFPFTICPSHRLVFILAELLVSRAVDTSALLRPNFEVCSRKQMHNHRYFCT